MRTIEVGIRELQRATSSFMGRVENGLHLIVTRHGRPIAILLPIQKAQAWALRNRTLGTNAEIDLSEGFEWVNYGTIRMTAEAADRYDELKPGEQARAHRELGVLRRLDGHGRLVIRIGLLWALVDLDGRDEAPAVLAIAARHELDRWLWAGEQESLRAIWATARAEGHREDLDA